MNTRPDPTAVGIIDRTGLLLDFVPMALDRLGCALEVVDLGSVAEFGPASRRVHLLLLGPKELSTAGLRKAVRYQAAHPGTVVVAAGAPAQGPSDEVLRASGIRHCLRGALTLAKVTSTLGRAYQELRLIAEDTLGVLDPPADVRVELPPDVRVELAADVPGGQRAIVITVASATGGCGKTFLSTNIAALLARSGRRCLLVDMDLQFGEVAAALRVGHPYSVFDGLYDGEGRALPKEDMAAHLGQLVHHHLLGFDVLTAPRDPALADYVGAKDATTVLDVVSPAYEVVVVDTPPSLNEVVLTVLDRSDIVAVLATLDVPSLKNLTVFLATLRRLRIDAARIRLVLNKVEADIGISVTQAQEAFDNGFVATIPLSRAVSRAINAGTVVVEREPRSPVARQLTAAVASVLPPGMATGSVPPRAATSWWSRRPGRGGGGRGGGGRGGAGRGAR